MFFIINLGVCILGGALFGTAAWLLLGVAAEKSLMPLISFPVVVIYYALPVTIPFGTAAAVIATMLFKLLSLPRWRPSGKGAWICTGSVIGLLLGGTFPFFLVLIGFEADNPIWRFHWGGVGAVAGIACGFIVGWVGWREVQHGKA